MQPPPPPPPMNLPKELIRASGRTQLESILGCEVSLQGSGFRVCGLGFGVTVRVRAHRAVKGDVVQEHHA